MRIPAGTIEQQLRAAMRNGRTPEQAVSSVLRPYGEVLRAAGNDSLVASARPSVLAQARRLCRQIARKAEDRAFGSGPASDDRLRLRELVFRLPDGRAVSWAEATAEEHGLRIAWLRTYLGTVELDLARHERAVKLLAEHGAARLSEVAGWESLIGDEVDDGGGGDDASGDVAA